MEQSERVRRRGAVRVAGLIAALLVTAAAVATPPPGPTPLDFGDITLPVDVASIASAVFTVGGSVLVAVLALWVGFKLVKKAARRMAGGV